MSIFDLFSKTEATKVRLEIFKGQLEKAAIVDCSKKEFAENANLMESVLIVDGADEKVITRTKEKLSFDINITDDFKLSYLVLLTNENKISKIIGIVTEGLEEDLAKLLKDNNYILRIRR